MELNIKTWNEKDYQNFINYLLSLKDEKYLEFNKKLIFSKYEMIGIRMPILKKIANEIFKGNYLTFLELCQYKYYEEIMIIGFILTKIKDISLLEKYLDSFLLKIDNWAICDSFCNSLKIVSLNKDYFWNKILYFLKQKEEYTVRVGLILILNFYVEEKYLQLIFQEINQINREEYYINMGIAWLICECFIKEREKTLKFLKNNNLNKFTNNKAISKIRESYRVTKEDKDIVNKLKKV